MGALDIIRTPAFDLLVREYSRKHSKLEADLVWLMGRLAEAPDLMGDHVPELGKLVLPIFKTRCKDSCHKIGAALHRVCGIGRGRKRRPVCAIPVGTAFHRVPDLPKAHRGQKQKHELVQSMAEETEGGCLRASGNRF